MPKVSVIMPVYNAERYLYQCLDSITEQTLKDIEIVCIDDGSTDNSFDILMRYSNNDKRFVVKKSKNQGAAQARNIGLEYASGPYIGFVDSDDWIDGNYYEALYNKAILYDADLARTTYKHIEGNAQRDDIFNKIIEDKCKNDTQLNVNDHSVAIWNAIYRRDYLVRNNIKFDVSMKKLHDTLFTAKAAYYSHKSVSVIGTYYHHRESIAGQLSSFNVERVDFSRLANRKVIEFINSVKYQNERDYLTAFKRCIWRYNMVFEKILSEGLIVSADYLRLYFDEFVNEFNKCKHIDLLLTDYKENYFGHLIKKDFNSYLIDKKRKISISSKISLLKKLFSVRNERGHKVFRIFGLKIKIRRSKI
ncbi:MAG: glycosyltransferase [Elusimicrobiota bacterium]|nr:glycosyltransferase [Elusimicrobiota bacterium]